MPTDPSPEQFRLVYWEHRVRTGQCSQEEYEAAVARIRGTPPPK